MFLQDIMDYVNKAELLTKLLRVALVIFVFMIIKYIVNKILNSQIHNKIINEKYEYKSKTVFSLVKNLVNIVLYFLAITFILNIFSVNTSSIVALAGVGGMALAFASQSLIEDVISGAILIMENQNNIGDLLTIGDVTATVKSVGLRVTKLEDIDGREIIIPNGEINKVTNHSINRMRAAVTVYISDNTPFEMVEMALNEACEATYLNLNLLDKPVIIGVENLDVEGYQVLLSTMVEPGSQWNVERYLRKEIIKSLQKANISFARLFESKSKTHVERAEEQER